MSPKDQNWLVHYHQLDPSIYPHDVNKSVVNCKGKLPYFKGFSSLVKYDDLILVIFNPDE